VIELARNGDFFATTLWYRVGVVFAKFGIGVSADPPFCFSQQKAKKNGQIISLVK